MVDVDWLYLVDFICLQLSRLCIGSYDGTIAFMRHPRALAYLAALYANQDAQGRALYVKHTVIYNTHTAHHFFQNGAKHLDVRCVLLPAHDVPGPNGPNGPNQNTFRIQCKKV